MEKGVLTRIQAVRLNGWYRSMCVHCSGTEAEALEGGLVAALSGGGAYGEHVRPWLEAHIKGGRVEAPHEGQKGCADVIATLRAQPFWDIRDVGINEGAVTAAAAAAVAEVLRIKHANTTAAFQPYRNPTDMCGNDSENDTLGAKATSSGSWNVSYMDLHGLPGHGAFRAVEDELSGMGRAFGHSLVSCLSPGTEILPHRGPTNKKLRLYVPLVVQGDCGLEVCGTERILQEGGQFVFDDSFLHSAWNRSASARYVLLADVWHPDLSDEEVALLAIMQAVHERALQSPQNASDTNPYSTISAAQSAQVPPSELFAGL